MFVRHYFSVVASCLVLMINWCLTTQDNFGKLLEEDICAQLNLQHTALCWSTSCTAFTTETMKNAVQCGMMAMIIIDIKKHCLLHELKKKVDWQESKMLPPVTSNASGPTSVFTCFLFYLTLVRKFLEDPWDGFTGLTVLNWAWDGPDLDLGLVRTRVETLSCLTSAAINALL